MNGFERRREQKKESIRRAAAYLFLENGADKVTMREIADKAHVSHVTIFKYFTSKQDLLQEVIRWFYEQEYKQLEAIVKGEQPYPERLKEIISQKRTALDVTDLNLASIANASSALNESLNYYHNKKNELYHNFLDEGKKKGYIRPGASVRALIVLGEGLRALAKWKPEVLAELKYDKNLMQECIETLLFGVMDRQKTTESA